VCVCGKMNVLNTGTRLIKMNGGDIYLTVSVNYYYLNFCYLNYSYYYFYGENTRCARWMAEIFTDKEEDTQTFFFFFLHFCYFSTRTLKETVFSFLLLVSYEDDIFVCVITKQKEQSELFFLFECFAPFARVQHCTNVFDTFLVLSFYYKSQWTLCRRPPPLLFFLSWQTKYM